MIFLLDPTGRVATWNAGAERIKGYAAPEIVGKHFSLFYPEEDVRAGKCEMELDVATREGRFEDENWRVRKDGSLFWANVVITALFENDELVGFAKATRDLTERKLAEEERIERAADQRAREIADAANCRKTSSRTSVTSSARPSMSGRASSSPVAWKRLARSARRRRSSATRWRWRS